MFTLNAVTLAALTAVPHGLVWVEQPENLLQNTIAGMQQLRLQQSKCTPDSWHREGLDSAQQLLASSTDKYPVKYFQPFKTDSHT